MEVCEDFLPLELASSNAILGVQWLQKLGTVMINWKMQKMVFELRGQTFKIKDDPALVRAQISLKAMMKMLRKEKKGFMIECNHRDLTVAELGTKPQDEGEIPEFLVATVENHERVFQEPKGLPPSRGREHSIVLKAGSNPVSVRPYGTHNIKRTKSRG